MAEQFSLVRMCEGEYNLEIKPTEKHNKLDIVYGSGRRSICTYEEGQTYTQAILVCSYTFGSLPMYNSGKRFTAGLSSPAFILLNNDELPENLGSHSAHIYYIKITKEDIYNTTLYNHENKEIAKTTNKSKPTIDDLYSSIQQAHIIKAQQFEIQRDTSVFDTKKVLESQLGAEYYKALTTQQTLNLRSGWRL